MTPDDVTTLAGVVVIIVTSTIGGAWAVMKWLEKRFERKADKDQVERHKTANDEHIKEVQRQLLRMYEKQDKFSEMFRDHEKEDRLRYDKLTETINSNFRELLLAIRGHP